jgi:hypothetical protein
MIIERQPDGHWLATLAPRHYISATLADPLLPMLLRYAIDIDISLPLILTLIAAAFIFFHIIFRH